MTKSTFENRLDAALVPPAAELVAAYFDPAGPFAADTFDGLGVNHPTAVMNDDLLALTMLDVRLPPQATRALLGPAASTVSRLLAEVPIGTALWDATDDHLDAATATWEALRFQPGIDWVIAGKLLARKRPLLIPVFDSVIKEALQPAVEGFWRSLREHWVKADVERR